MLHRAWSRFMASEFTYWLSDNEKGHDCVGDQGGAATMLHRAWPRFKASEFAYWFSENEQEHAKLALKAVKENCLVERS